MPACSTLMHIFTCTNGASPRKTCQQQQVSFAKTILVERNPNEMKKKLETPTQQHLQLKNGQEFVRQTIKEEIRYVNKTNGRSLVRIRIGPYIWTFSEDNIEETEKACLTSV